MKARVLEKVEFNYPNKEGVVEKRNLLVMNCDDRVIEGLSLKDIEGEDLNKLNGALDTINEIFTKYVRTNYRKFLQEKVSE